MSKANCVVCGAEFEKKGPAKTCTKECRKTRSNELARNRRKAYYSDPENRLKESERKRVKEPKKTNCLECGKAFNKNRSSKTCSSQCSKERSKWRHRNYQNKRYKADKEFRERVKQASRSYSKRLHSDPSMKEKRTRKRKGDSKIRQLRILADDQYRELIRKKARDWYQRKSIYDEEFVAIRRKYGRERYRNRKAAERLGIPPLLYAAIKAAERFSESQAQTTDQS